MFKPHEFAGKLGLSVKTLQRWDATGKLPAKHTLSGHRFYTEDDLLIANGLKPIEVILPSTGISGRFNGYNSLLLLSPIWTAKLLQGNQRELKQRY